jgi:hypothetical protein
VRGGVLIPSPEVAGSEQLKDEGEVTEGENVDEANLDNAV